MIHDPPGHAAEPALGPATERALAAIAVERARQVAQFGHTAEADLGRRVEDLPIRASQELRGAIDYCQFHRLTIAERYLVKAGALILAALERLYHEKQQEPPL